MTTITRCPHERSVRSLPFPPLTEAETDQRCRTPGTSVHTGVLGARRQAAESSPGRPSSLAKPQMRRALGKLAAQLWASALLPTDSQVFTHPGSPARGGKQCRRSRSITPGALRLVHGRPRALCGPRTWAQTPAKLLACCVASGK